MSEEGKRPDDGDDRTRSERSTATAEAVEPAPGSGDKPPLESPEPERTQPPGAAWLPDVITTLLAIALALVVGAVLIALSDEEAVQSLSYVFSYPADFFSYAGEAIWESYSSLVAGSVGSLGAIGTTLVRAAPLICAGLGVTLAFRAGLFNIGAQGQLVVGSLTAGYVGFTWDLPPGIHLLAAILAGMIGGALWGGIAGLLKARTGAHEVITTIMLNYLATSFLLNYLLSKDAFQRAGSDNAQSPPVSGSARYLELGNIHLGVFVAVAAAIVVWWLIERSTFGFELRAVGANPDASRTAGMSVERAGRGPAGRPGRHDEPPRQGRLAEHRHRRHDRLRRDHRRPARAGHAARHRPRRPALRGAERGRDRDAGLGRDSQGAR